LTAQSSSAPRASIWGAGRRRAFRPRRQWLLVDQAQPRARCLRELAAMSSCEKRCDGCPRPARPETWRLDFRARRLEQLQMNAADVEECCADFWKEPPRDARSAARAPFRTRARSRPVSGLRSKVIDLINHFLWIYSAAASMSHSSNKLCAYLAKCRHRLVFRRFSVAKSGPESDAEPLRGQPLFVIQPSMITRPDQKHPLLIQNQRLTATGNRLLSRN